MIRISLCIVCLALLFGVPTSVIVAQESYDGKVDIAAQLTIAHRTFDTSKVDAIILSEGRSVTLLSDNRLSTLVHRILLINSNLAADMYADNRIPFDQEHCSFTPLALRTWRENKWWPTDSTGIVETLPFALDHAVDYSGVREMLLLHNGVEIPCIVEMAFRIEDKTPFRTSADGSFQFQRDEPVVQSWFELVVPTGTTLHLGVSADVPPAARTTDPERRVEVVRWEMGPLPASPLPHTEDQQADVPHVVWSAWKGWSDLASFVLHPFQASDISDPLLVKAADSLLRSARTAGETLTSIARFISERVTLINYPEAYWWSNPRSADRVYNSAYGHRLDRAILASTLFKKAGFSAQPVFVSKGMAPIDLDIPSLAPFEGINLLVTAPDLQAMYRPDDGAISYGDAGMEGRMVWQPDADRLPHRIEAATAHYVLRIDLSYDKEKTRFVGKGALSADGGMCPFSQMTGLESEAKTYLVGLAASIMKGTTVTEYNVGQFDPKFVSVGFALELPKPEPDDFGRSVLAIGRPKGGIFDRLPHDILPVQMERQSAVRLPCPLSQRLELAIDTALLQVVYNPAPQSIENAAGRFSDESVYRDGRLVVVRELQLVKTLFVPSEWPALRQLLLAEGNAQSGLLMFKHPSGDKK